MSRVVDVEQLRHAEPIYAIAIERGDYRRALRIALYAARRLGSVPMWRDIWYPRVGGCFARRHRDPITPVEAG